MDLFIPKFKDISFIKKLQLMVFVLTIQMLIVIVVLNALFLIDERGKDKLQSLDILSQVVFNFGENLHRLNNTINQYVLYHNDDDRRSVEKNIPELLAGFSRLQEKKMLFNQMRDVGVHMKEDFQIYTRLVHVLFQQIQQYGVTQDRGLQGDMRSFAHKLEKQLQFDSELGMQLLQIRRSEKDFMLREKEEYAVAHQQQIHALLAKLESSDIANLEELVRLLTGYQDKSHKCFALQRSIRERTEEISTFWDLIADGLAAMQVRTQQIRGNAQHTHREKIESYSLYAELAVAAVLIVAILMLSFIFYKNIITPVSLLTEWSKAIINGNYDRNISLSRLDEIGVLADHLYIMKERLCKHTVNLEKTIRIRTEHLEITNQALEDTIEQLNSMQKQMLQSEKLASLGRLVSGFAHEINTPIGIGLTAISALPAVASELERMLTHDEIDEDEMDRCLAQIKNCSALGVSNMRRASELVTRFKRTSVDQASESVRRFNVLETLNDIMLTLHHTFKSSRVSFELDGPQDLMVLSHPGLLGQVFTNLMLNSFKHGFDNGQRAGMIQIRFVVDGSPPNLHFWYRDNGRGIKEADLQQLFEPFFTTAREAGGSGLGTYIVYNIITGVLKGSIHVSSLPDEGVLFDFSFPIELIEGSGKK